jgi:hypothetical protein
MNTTIEITPEQRELLLTGLRYVRSSIALEVREWSQEVERDRDRQYEQLERLEAVLTGARKSAPSRV